MSRDLLVVDMGIEDYQKVWNLQKELVSRRVVGDVPDLIILVEHPSVITLGRKGKPEDVYTSLLPMYSVERGGQATYHGPGQLVGYPIVDLRSKGLEVLWFLRSIEDVIIRALKTFGIPGERKDKHTGVWVHDKKIASIGIAVRSWVTFHGFALNVNPDLRMFDLLRPCGLEPQTITSMSALLSGEVSLANVKNKVIENFAAVFDYAPVYTDEFFITREILAS